MSRIEQEFEAIGGSQFVNWSPVNSINNSLIELRSDIDKAGSGDVGWQSVLRQTPPSSSATGRPSIRKTKSLSCGTT